MFTVHSYYIINIIARFIVVVNICTNYVQFILTRVRTGLSVDAHHTESRSLFPTLFLLRELFLTLFCFKIIFLWFFVWNERFMDITLNNLIFLYQSLRMYIGLAVKYIVHHHTFNWSSYNCSCQEDKCY